MSIRLLAGDCRDVLPTLAAESVHCVVCSPPYYALRSYLDASHPDKHRELGSEATPEAYIAAMVGVFREVRRVLRGDGTCWVNMGDSYASTPSGSFDKGGRGSGALEGGGFRSNKARSTVGNGAKPKDLLMMPARLALALQADGWWVRSDIIWAKPNPMPESCTDRPTSSYEHVFLLTRSARYYYDADAVREERTGDIERPTFRGGCYTNGRTDNGTLGASTDIGNRRTDAASRNLRNVWTLATYSFPGAHFATYPPELAERCIRAGTSERGCCAQCGVPWVRVTASTLYSSTYGDSRRADIPGSNKMKGRADEYDGGRFSERMRKETLTTGWTPGCKCEVRCQRMGCRMSGTAPVLEDGVCPKCGTQQGVTVPCTVLDPFAGAGTTLLVADRLQRDALGIELNTQYTTMAMERCRADAPLFTSFPPAEDPEDGRMADLFDMAAD